MSWEDGSPATVREKGELCPYSASSLNDLGVNLGVSCKSEPGQVSETAPELTAPWNDTSIISLALRIAALNLCLGRYPAILLLSKIASLT